MRAAPFALSLAALVLIEGCRPAAPPDLADQARIAVRQRLGPNFELHYTARHMADKAEVICGYAGPKVSPDPGGQPFDSPQAFVYAAGRLYLLSDMGPDPTAFVAKHCGSDLPFQLVRPVP